METSSQANTPVAGPASTLARAVPSVSPFLAGFRAARANLVPGLCVQVFMLGIIYAYFRLPQLRPWFDQLGRFKQGGSYLFTAVSSVIAGAFLPAVFTLVCLEKRLPAWRDAGAFLFAGTFYTINGLSVDLLYRWQAVWFGEAHTLLVLMKKILVDQFIYNPVFSAPFAVICFAWKNQDYALRAPPGTFTPRAYLRRVVPTLLATWVVWIPVVAVLYSLPPLLQIPIYSLALCFWALMLAFIHAKPKPVS